jgi:hypothetical protein
MAKTIYPDAETIRRAANRAKATAVDNRFSDDFINARTYDPYDPPESMKQVENNTDTVTTMVDQSYLAPAMNDYNDDGGFAPAIGALKEFAKNFTGGDTQTVTEQSYLWAQDPDAPTANESLNAIGKAIQPTLDAAVRSTTTTSNTTMIRRINTSRLGVWELCLGSPRTTSLPTVKPMYGRPRCLRDTIWMIVLPLTLTATIPWRSGNT